MATKISFEHKARTEHATSETMIEHAPESQVKDLLPDYGRSWIFVPHLRTLNIMLLVPLLTSYVSGFDGSMLNGMQSLPYWNKDFNNPSGSALGLVNTIQVIGAIGALPIAPWLADRYGRRAGIFGGSLILIVGSLVMGFGHNLGSFLGGRALVGFGGSFVTIAAAPLVGELAYPSHRPILTSIYNTTWYLGAIVAAWASYGTFKMPNSWSWRVPCLLQAVPSVIQIVTVYFIPESPRWLVAHDRPEEAQRVLIRYHAGSEEPTELVLAEMEEITAAIQMEKLQNTSSYLDFLKTPGNRHRIFICVFMGFLIQWCGNGLVSFYLVQVLKSVGITDPKIQNIVNGVLQIYNYFVAIVSALAVERFGRRRLFLISIGGMLVAFVIWTAISAVNQQQNFENKGLGIGVVIMIFVFFLFYNIGMNPVPVTYMLEILPYTLRTKGLTIFNLSQFCSSIFNGFANPIALAAIAWKYYIVYCCVLVAWFIIVWFTFPETRGRSLEEVSLIFDGDQALQRTTSYANSAKKGSSTRNIQEL